MKIYLALLCAFLFMTPSMAQDKASPLNMDLNKVQYKIEIPDMKDSTSIRYSDIYSNVQTIMLEAPNNDAIVGTISKMEITNDGDIILLDDINGKVVRYDSCGHFLNLIGAKGHGPNEYVDPRAMCYDKYDNQVLIWDHGTAKILFFDIKGKVQKKLAAPYPWDMEVIGPYQLLYFYDYPKEKSLYNYLIVTKNGKEVSKFEYIPDASSLNERPSTTTVFRYSDNDALLCRSALSSIIYKAQEGKVSPYIELTSKDNNWAIGRPEKIEKTYEKQYNANILNVLVANGKVLIDGYHFKDEYPFVYYNDMKGHIRAGQKVINDMEGFVSWICVIQSKGSKIYYYVNPDDYAALAKSWKNRQDIPQSDKDFVSKLANSANPIIQVCTVK